ncbi:MAG: hypothetical protein HY302_10460 [Opitutae bacterium]|nr:hypothetical protein [Opitutae bacterium]
MSPRLPARVALGLALGALAGCASSPVQLALTAPPAAARRPLPARAISVVFAPTTDLRPEYQQSGVGHVGGRDVVAGQLLAWIDRSLQSLHGASFAVQSQNGAGAWHVTPLLRQFYTASVAVSKNANVVLELQIQPPTGPALTRVYRGRVNAVNWWNSAGEIEGTVVNALGDCLGRITRDLDALVQSPPAPAG